MKQLNQILNFEIRVFYCNFDLYRTYFLHTLAFQEFYNLIEKFSIIRKRLYL